MNDQEHASDPSPNPPSTIMGDGPSGYVGTVIGPYKLMEQIGEGGFGLVFVAEQMSPVRRKVAIKVIKPGMDTRDVIARFEAERQALAMMDHPNIARVLDAGATDSGRPYFVMELVRGVPITDYCDKNRLTPRERLELFVVVCQAVQHAHQKGIIHRDLKPSNVMVTLHDGRPLVKVIDFGVAKALHQSLTEKTIYTRFAQMVGTPLYMSPEQAEMSGLDIDTRTDIYSLGVMMYELLTGSTPFDKKRVAKAAYDDLIRMIREEEPPKPSTRLSQSTASLPAIAEHRRTESARLSKMFRGDLDWITMKALEKDRTRRYESASGLAADVQRYLHDEPVEASPPSAVYRLRKLARRHRAALVVSAAFAAFLIADAIAGTWLAFREKSARDVADRNAALAAESAGRASAEAEIAEKARLASESQRKLADEQRQRAETEKARADANAVQAEQGRRQADAARQTAEAEKRRADTNAAEAERRRAEADSERKRAELLSDQAERRVYAMQIAGAQREWEANNAEDAWAHLDKSRRDLRGWEHDYLFTLFLQNQKTFKGHKSAVTSVAFSPDGRWIVSGSYDGTANVWDAASGQVTLTLDAQTGPVTCIAFSSDGKRIASGTTGRMIQVWDAANGQALRALKGHTRPIAAVAFSPDGSRIASGSWDKTVKVWDAGTGSELHTLKGHTESVASVAFSPDGKRIASGSDDKTVKVWDASGGREALTLKGHTGPVSSVAFSPDGARIVSGGSNGSTLRVWDASSGRQTLAIKGQAYSASVAFSPDGKRIASGGFDNSLRVLDASTGSEVLTLKGHAGRINSVAFSPDGKRIASGSNDGTVKVWGAGTSQHVPTFKGHNNRVTCVAFSPDGKRIASGGWDQTIKIWDAASRQELLTLKGFAAPVLSVAWSPDGKRIVSGCREANPPKVSDATTGKEVLTLRANSFNFNRVAFSPDGKRIIAGSERVNVERRMYGAITLWDSGTAREVLAIEQHGPVQIAAFSSDGKKIASGTQFGTLEMFDAASGNQLLSFNDPSESEWKLIRTITPVPAVAFSPDGTRIVSGSGDKTLKIWDTATGKLAFRLEGHTGSVTSVAFSPDGTRIVSGSDDTTLKLWDAATGEETLTLKGHSGGVTSVAWSPDGRRIASSSQDGTLRLWDASNTQRRVSTTTQGTHR
jgi:WD40 repeat protein/serine/threonine protein kinase